VIEELNRGGKLPPDFSGVAAKQPDRRISCEEKEELSDDANVPMFRRTR